MARAARKSGPSYAKISATLEDDVLRKIRERTENVSGFLNDAAKEKLYFERLRAFAEELQSQGVEMDQVMYRNLKDWTRATRTRKATKRNG